MMLIDDDPFIVNFTEADREAEVEPNVLSVDFRPSTNA